MKLEEYGLYRDTFTYTELRVLEFLSLGKTNKQIASLLNVSVKTIETHVSNLLLKCSFPNRTTLAAHETRYLKSIGATPDA